MRLPLLLSAAIASTSLLAVPSALATTGCNAAGWGDGRFTDVRGCDSSYPAIEYLKEKKIVEGYQDGTYRPEGLITRAELTKILMATRSTAKERADCVAKAGAVFRDVPNGEWFSPYVCIAKARDVISGYPDGGFAPHAWINYAEAAKIAANSYGLPVPAADQGDDRWYAPYSFALLARHAVPPTVSAYDGALMRGEMAEMIYRLETSKTSMAWFAAIEDGDAVRSDEVDSPLRDTGFWYPGSQFSAEEGVMTIRDIYGPLGERSVHSLEIAHVRPQEDEEGCNGMAGTSGRCRPSKSLLAISVGELDLPYAHALLGFNSYEQGFNSEVTVDGRKGVSLYEGVECEGIETTFVPMDVARTLVIRRTKDCNPKPEEELSSEEQDALFAKLLGTIRIDAAFSAKPAPTMQVAILLCPFGPGAQDDTPTVRLTRTVPQSASVADMTLRAMINGFGRSGEKAQTCRGMWGLAQGDYRGVTIQGDVATVKLARPFAEIYGDDGESSVSAQRAVSANLKQFPSVKTVRYVVQP